MSDVIHQFQNVLKKKSHYYRNKLERDVDYVQQTGLLDNMKFFDIPILSDIQETEAVLRVIAYAQDLLQKELDSLTPKIIFE